MQEITSLQNSIVKEIYKLQQKKYRKDFILLEGKKSVKSAVEAGLEIQYIFMPSHKTIKEFESDKTFLVSDAIMKKLSTTDSPPEIIMTAKRPYYNIKDFLNFKKIILLDSIKDVGNLGTIIRASAAFGVDSIILYGDSTDPYSPKVIRSAAGNMFKIPIIEVNKEDLSHFKNSHKFLATVVNSNKYINDFKKPEKMIVMFGSEADGLCKELLSLADDKLTLKMANNVESLNLAVSTGIILYILQN